MFTCVTVDSSSMAWSSEEYIGPGGDRLSLFIKGTTRRASQHCSASLVERYVESGSTVLVSTLRIRVQPDIWTATITCHSVGTGEMQSITFILNSKLIILPCEIIAKGY